MDVVTATDAGRPDSRSTVLLAADGRGGVPPHAVGHPSERPAPAGPSGPIASVAADVVAGIPAIVVARAAAPATSTVRPDAGAGRRRRAGCRWEVRGRGSDSGSATAPDARGSDIPSRRRRARTPRRLRGERSGRGLPTQEGESR